MSLQYRLPNEQHVPAASDASEHGALSLLITLAGPASAKIRKQLGLPAKATLLHVLAKRAGLDPAQLDPLARLSTGIYTEQDYLAQFSEDWEVEEYGRHAPEVIAQNFAAWQAPGPLLAALDAALAALADRARAQSLLPEGWENEGRDALGRLRERIARAIERGATEVCLEIDDLD